jgi:hypothetical protein
MALLSVFSVSQGTSDVTVIPCCMNSTVSTPFLSRKQLPSAFWQEDVWLKFFGLSGECVCNHRFGCSLVSKFTNEIQASSPVPYMT